MFAAYNAGPGRYEDYLAGRPLPAETHAYVAALLPMLGADERAAPATIVAAAVVLAVVSMVLMAVMEWLRRRGARLRTGSSTK